jgi:hypothetical protein
MLPLIFRKLQLFKNVYIIENKDLYGYLLGRLRMIFQNIAERPLLTQRRIYREFKETILKLDAEDQEAIAIPTESIRRIADSTSLEFEINLALYFGWESRYNPLIDITKMGLETAKYGWESPSGHEDSIMFQIMQVAYDDPELKEFFDNVIDYRKSYSESTLESSNKLESFWHQFGGKKQNDSNGEVKFRSFATLVDKQRILLNLHIKYLQYENKLTESPSLSISEIAENMRRPKNTLPPLIHELVNEGYIVELSDERYEISRYGINKINEKDNIDE